MAEIQATSQSPIFFRLVEDGDRRCESDLGIPVPKSLVIWVSLPLGIPKTMILLLSTKLVRAKLFERQHLQSV